MKTWLDLGFSMAPEEKGDSSDVRTALEQEKFEIVFLLLQLQHSKGNLEASLGELWSRYDDWKKENRQRVLELTLPQAQAKELRQPEVEKVEKSNGNWQVNPSCREIDPKGAIGRDSLRRRVGARQCLRSGR